MVPAEQVEVTDFRGARGTASGSSYAVPRVAALAARLKAANPDWSTGGPQGGDLRPGPSRRSSEGRAGSPSAGSPIRPRVRDL